MNTHISNTPDFSPLKGITYRLWEIVRKNMFWDLQIEEKSGAELVTWIDRKIEQEAKKLITQEFWKVDFLWEEFGNEENGSEIRFIIDPLDGTESFINREFNTTISIWVEVSGVLQYGIVYDFMKDILYEWGSESSLYFQDTQIPLLTERYSKQTRILISGVWEEVSKLKEKLREQKNIKITQMYWSVALQATQTASGNYDAYIRSWKIKPWDIAGAASFAHWVPDTQILSRRGQVFDHRTPEQWVIIVKNTLADELLNIII